jgi:DNA-binding CsgD family transcriptional regulator
VKRGAALEHLTDAIIEICRSGLPPQALRDRALARLRRAVPFDAAFWASVDPTTLLVTQAYQEEISVETVPYFIQNEIFGDDVNRWTTLAREPLGVGTLLEATAGDIDASGRYRDIFRPLGLGDELRAVLRIGGACWGFMCLHRAVGALFSRDEVLYLHRLAPHLAEGTRAGLLVSSLELTDAADAPGLVLLAPDGSLASISEAGERWLEELGHPDPDRQGLPFAVHALAASLRGSDAAQAALPRIRVQTRAGRWVVLHASRLAAHGTQAIAVIIEEPSPAELAPVLMMAYGLTKQEQTVTGLVCRGLSTREITDRLHISLHTVQEHLKNIFDKTGVRSRRELVATILQEQYLPRTMAGQPVGPSGFFAEPARPPHV